jgi:hypothetical protein
MIDMEIALARTLGWSLHDIDATDSSSLLEFVARLTANGGAEPKKVFVDQVDWL